MTNRVSLLCVPATRALRSGCFPADTPLDMLDAQDVARLATLDSQALGQPHRTVSSPRACARATAQALNLAATFDDDLREVDYGEWAGRSLKDVAASQPDALSAWLADPAMDAHGGESMQAVLTRASRWLDQCEPGHTLAVTHASVIRSIVLHVLEAPARAGMRIDIAPLTFTTLSGHAGQWRVASVAVPLHFGGVGGDAGGAGGGA